MSKRRPRPTKLCQFEVLIVAGQLRIYALDNLGRLWWLDHGEWVPAAPPAPPSPVPSP